MRIITDSAVGWCGLEGRSRVPTPEPGRSSIKHLLMMILMPQRQNLSRTKRPSTAVEMILGIRGIWVRNPQTPPEPNEPRLPSPVHIPYELVYLFGCSSHHHWLFKSLNVIQTTSLARKLQKSKRSMPPATFPWAEKSRFLLGANCFLAQRFLSQTPSLLLQGRFFSP